MDAEVKIQVIIAQDSDKNRKLVDQGAAFIALTIERVMQQEYGSATGFNPETGEPMFVGGHYPPDILNSINSITVQSPHAMLNILHTQFNREEEIGCTVEPVIIEAWVGDDDD
jgi:hypothetical protein